MANIFNTYDLAAMAWFLTIWAGFSWLADRSPWASRSLSYQIANYRRRWMQVMAKRDLRMIDTSIVAGLQQGTAFFASTSILAIGGCFALLGSADQVLQIFDDLPVSIATSRPVWEAKVIGLIMIYAFAFFKFGWAYRLFNYCSILIGSIPLVEEHDENIDAEVIKAAELNVLAGNHFNAGLRGIFFSIGYLCWFLGPVIWAIGTLFVALVLIRRQFFSASRKLMTNEESD